MTSNIEELKKLAHSLVTDIDEMREVDENGEKMQSHFGGFSGYYIYSEGGTENAVVVWENLGILVDELKDVLEKIDEAA